MNHLLAKIKGRNGELLKVMSNERGVFDIPELLDNKTYSSSYKLEDDQWYKLDNFLSRGYENSLTEKAFNSTDYNQITKKQYSKIDYLCSKQGEFFLFQKMSQTCLLYKKWFHISDAPKIEIDKPIIVLNRSIDAVYDINNDSLYFINISRIKTMFKGIEELYREATKVEVDNFLKSDFISLKESYTSNNVKTANRKRIAMANDTLEEFTLGEKQKIFQYIKSYCVDVPIYNNTFLVSTEEHLKKILYGIEQRYYTTPIGNEKRMANSVCKLTND